MPIWYQLADQEGLDCAPTKQTGMSRHWRQKTRPRKSTAKYEYVLAAHLHVPEVIHRAFAINLIQTWVALLLFLILSWPWVVVDPKLKGLGYMLLIYPLSANIRWISGSRWYWVKNFGLDLGADPIEAPRRWVCLHSGFDRGLWVGLSSPEKKKKKKKR
jgi:hypothetical protein